MPANLKPGDEPASRSAAGSSKPKQRVVSGFDGDTASNHHKVEFDLRQLEVFSKVVELGSISRAGRAVGLAQASVSERMSNLESSIGVPLLDRLGRKIVPTKAGQLLYEHAKSHLALKRTTCQALEEFMGVRRGDVTIGGSTIPGEYILPHAIAAFRKQQDAVIIRMTVESSSRICERVLEGQDELGVVGWSSPQQHLTFTELWPDELVLVAPSNHRWGGGIPIKMEEVIKEPFIQREGGSGTRAKLQADLESQFGFGCEQFNIVAQLGSSTAVKEAVKHGLGVSILSARAVAEDVKAGAITVVPLIGASFPRNFFLVQDERRTLSPMAALLVGFLKQYGSSSTG